MVGVREDASSVEDNKSETVVLAALRLRLGFVRLVRGRCGPKRSVSTSFGLVFGGGGCVVVRSPLVLYKEDGRCGGGPSFRLRCDCGGCGYGLVPFCSEDG